MCNGTRVHRGGKRGEVVVQRGTTFLDDLLDGLVLELVLVEQQVDVVVPLTATAPADPPHSWT